MANPSEIIGGEKAPQLGIPPKGIPPTDPRNYPDLIAHGRILPAPDLVNVKRFGAIGDGAHDDEPAFRKALSALGQEGLYVPHGTYKLGGQLSRTNAPLTFLGDGPHLSKLQWPDNSGGLSFASDDENNRVQVRGLSFLTEANGGGSALALDWSSASNPGFYSLLADLIIEGAVRADDYWTTGIDLIDARNCHINDIVVIGKTNTLLMKSIRLRNQCTNMMVRNSRFTYAQYGVWVDGGTTEGIWVADSTFIYTNDAVFLNTPARRPLAIIHHCHMDVFEHGVRAVGRGELIVTNNSIYKNPASTSDFQGIDIDSSGTKSRILGNYVWILNSAGTNRGIQVDAYDCTIADNTTISADVCIWLGSNSGNCVVHDNLGVSVTTGVVDNGTSNHTHDNFS